MLFGRFYCGSLQIRRGLIKQNLYQDHGRDFFGFSNLFFSFSTGIKDFSNWPTVPQVFFEGEFVGGCDILLDMHKNGELIEELKKLGIRSKLLDNPEQKA